MPRLCAVSLAFLCASLPLPSLLARPALAAWPSDPSVNVPLGTGAGHQLNAAIVADGSGGAIVAWQDGRSGYWHIYAQRVDAGGVPQWSANGVALCTAGGDQGSPTIVADGTGGEIVTWHDSRSGTWDIYVQRVNAAGAPQWTANATALCTASGPQEFPTIVADGSGGAIVTWMDDRSGSWGVYAQRVNGSGVTQWPANGVALGTATAVQAFPTIVADGSGGAIVTWQDSHDIYAQHVNAAGVPQWTASGVALGTATAQGSPTIATDGLGGAIVAWPDGRSAPGNDIYAQRVNAAGVPQWVANGVALCAAAGNQLSPAIVADGSGGAIVTWDDARSGVEHDLYAQRVNAAGVPQWAANGVALCTAGADQLAPRIVADGSGGAIVTWEDGRSLSQDIYAQRLNAAGVPQWTFNGVALCTAVEDQDSPAIVPDGSSGAIVTWYDYRSGTDYDVYAQRVQANGQLGGAATSVPGDPALALALDPVMPNPSRGGALRLSFTLAGSASAALELFDVAGRRIAAREVGHLGAGRHALDLVDGQGIGPGLYLVRLRQSTSARVRRVVVLD